MHLSDPIYLGGAQRGALDYVNFYIRQCQESDGLDLR